VAASALLCGWVLSAASNVGTDALAVRELITKRNAAYRSLDSKALAALMTPDFRLVDRLGDNYRSRGPELNARLWEWGFKYVYQGRPGPERRITNVEFVAPAVALVQTAAEWDEIVLDNVDTTTL
jgi:hypothetical protein